MTKVMAMVKLSKILVLVFVFQDFSYFEFCTSSLQNDIMDILGEMVNHFYNH